MVAGATGIDLFLMVVAADDGVMPQTREHAAVLRGARRRPTASSRSRRPTSPTRRRRRSEAAELLPGAEIVAVLGAHRRGRRRAARGARRAWPAALPGRARPRRRRRCCTSTARSPSAAPARWSPGRCGRARRARRPRSCCCRPATPRARARRAGPRRAGRARRRRPARGAQPRRRGAARGRPRRRGHRPGRGPRPTLRARRGARRCATPRHGERVHVHHGTRDAPGAARRLGGGLWQLRLEQPLLARAGDRVVVRSIAPPDTLGGGVVLDARPRRHGRRADVARAAGAPAPRRGREPEPRARAVAPAAARPSPARRPPLPGRRALALEARLRAAGHEPPDAADARRRRGDSPRCARPAAPSASAARCTPTRTRSPPSARASRRSSPPRARSRWRACATSSQTSRKYAQALLEHLDAARVTLRLPGRPRVLRRAHKETGLHRRPSGGESVLAPRRPPCPRDGPCPPRCGSAAMPGCSGSCGRTRSPSSPGAPRGAPGVARGRRRRSGRRVRRDRRAPARASRGAAAPSRSARGC